MSDFAIETNGLTKSFGGRVVVDGLDLRVPAGSVFGFLGPNGSGKTTSIRLILGLIFPTAGTVKLFGGDMPAKAGDVLPAVGAVVDNPAFYPFLSGRQNLERIEAMGKMRGRRETRANVERALEMVGLANAAGRRYRSYSLGMRQRLAMASAIVRPRRLLVLDEPTNGLDPQGTREVRNLIRRLNANGTTIFLSSHLLNEVDHLCTHAAVLRTGHVVAQGTMDELRTARQAVLRIQTQDVQRAHEVLMRTPGVVNVAAVHRAAGEGWVDVELQGALPEQVAAALVHSDVRLRSMSESRPSLEDTFVELTGEGFDVGE